MGTILILDHDKWSFDFRHDDDELLNRLLHECEICNIHILSSAYSYIIDCLKEANLLPEDYKQVCCYCFVLREFGLLELRQHLSSIIYKEDSDILWIIFRINEKYSNSLSRVYFRIHDYSKISRRFYLNDY